METSKKSFQEDPVRELKHLKMPSSGGLHKMDLRVGKTHRGTFWMNEYGEIQVRPEQSGTNPQGLCKHSEGHYYTIYTSKNSVQVRLTFPRLRMSEIVPMVKETFVEVIKKFYLYDFEK